MSMSQSVLICDQVNPVLNEILEKNGLQITYEPEITPEQIQEKIENFEVVNISSASLSLVFFLDANAKIFFIFPS